MVSVDEDGYVQIVDRAKDVIKSGGEWISSLELENSIMAHDDVAEATVIGVPHERWQERPLGDRSDGRCRRGGRSGEHRESVRGRRQVVAPRDNFVTIREDRGGPRHLRQQSAS